MYNPAKLALIICPGRGWLTGEPLYAAERGVLKMRQWLEEEFQSNDSASNLDRN